MDDLASSAGDATEGEWSTGRAGDGLVTTRVGTTPSTTATTASSASTTGIAAAAGTARREAAPSGGAARCSGKVGAGVWGAGGGCNGGFEFGSFSDVGFRQSVS